MIRIEKENLCGCRWEKKLTAVNYQISMYTREQNEEENSNT